MWQDEDLSLGSGVAKRSIPCYSSHPSSSQDLDRADQALSRREKIEKGRKNLRKSKEKWADPVQSPVSEWP